MDAMRIGVVGVNRAFRWVDGGRVAAGTELEGDTNKA